MPSWINNLRADRKRIKTRIIEAGQAAIAREAGINEMKVSRFVRNKGSESAEALYRLADAVGLTVVLVPKGSTVQVKGELFIANPS